MNVLKLVSGTTIASAITFLISPILTRLYHPEAFGAAAILFSIVSILQAVSCLRYEVSILLPEKEDEAFNLLGLSILIVSAISIILVPLLWIGREQIILLFNAPAELGAYLWLIPILVFLGGVFLALNYWNTRNKQFGRLSIARVANTTTTSGFQIGFGLAGSTTPGSLISASVIGSTIALMALALQIWIEDGRRLWRSLSWEKIFAGMKRYRKFPQYDAGARLLNSISWQLPTFILAFFFSPEIVGFYAIGNRVLRAPMELIGNSFAQVFIQRASKAYQDGTLAAVVESTFEKLARFTLLPMLILTFSGQEIFIFFFGETWAEAGFYTQMLSIWTFFWFISSPLSVVFRIVEKQEFSLALNIAIFLTRLLSLGIGGWLGEPRTAILLFSLSGVFLYGYLSFSVIQVSGAQFARVRKILFREVAFFLPIGVVLLAVKLLHLHPVIHVLLAITFAGAYYLYLLSSMLASKKPAAQSL